MINALSQIPGPKVQCDVDTFVPKQMAMKMEAAGCKKGKEMDVITTFILAFHAGIFVSFGAGFYMVVASTNIGSSQYGLTKFACGLAFCNGLGLVILCGSELFTGNALLTMAYLSNKITTVQMVKNWILAYSGNFIGSIAFAAFQLWARLYEACNGQVGKKYLDAVQVKCSMEWGQVFGLALLCNIMVCWAVWMTLSGHTSTDKYLVFLLPIAGFASMGFEHCVANMYFLTMAWMIKGRAPLSYWKLIGMTSDNYNYVAVGNCINKNLVPATIGNVVGAGFFVGAFYWYLYLRDADHVSRLQFQVGTVRFFASPPDTKRKKKVLK
jgi:formate transporter